MRRTDALTKSSYHTAHASMDNLAQEAETLEAWTQALEDSEGEEAAKVDEDIDIL